MFNRFSIAMAGALVLAAAPVSVADPKPALDFGFFKDRVEPIFLQKRSGHTRCYVCHGESNNALRLEKLQPGQTQWTREQSRHNFEVVSKLVTPGDPTTSMLYLRMNRRRDVFNMPPLASHEVDAEALAAVEAWIKSLAGRQNE